MQTPSTMQDLNSLVYRVVRSGGSLRCGVVRVFVLDFRSGWTSSFSTGKGVGTTYSPNIFEAIELTKLTCVA